MPVMLVNDEDHEVEGTVTLALDNQKGEQVAQQTAHFKVAALGQQTLYQDFQFPSMTGDFVLRAIVQYSENGKHALTQSRRRVQIVAASNGQN
jgi:hypothetical protein